MAPLAPELRRLLASTIVKAREEAETGARNALDVLAVGRHEPHGSMSPAERTLRNRLRRHGRQLGDHLDKQQGAQETDMLVREIAYEHWHRMLFARFLAENELLIEPENQVSITMEVCEELAHETGENPHQLAARFAQIALPQIFKPESPVFELPLPPEHQQKLERLITKLPAELFRTTDALGWVYQFWQTQRKDEVNKSEVKVGARELAPVTQLFTEPYMVSFLLDNALGAWWASHRLDKNDLQNASHEDELRRKAAIDGVPLQYLRFVRQDNEPWEPAAGTFPAWPDKLGDLKVLDPCCGSGHFLVAAFYMLVPMRMEREGLNARDAADAVLRDNLHGLELDQRCVALAAFALALAAWTYPEAGGYRPLPELHLACSGVAVSVSKDEWKSLAKGDQNLSIALDWMHDAFKNAPVLGSLVDPTASEAAKIVDMDELTGALQQALQQEESGTSTETAIVAQGLAKAAVLLSGRYHWVITNVPYLARGKQNEVLRDFCQTHYTAAKNDLATVFLERCLKLCTEGGTASVVLPQNWLFLTSYRKFREMLLKRDRWRLIARLGPGAFETISGEVVKAVLLTLSRGQADRWGGGLLGPAGSESLIRGLDVSEPRTAGEKAAGLVVGEVKSVGQAGQLGNPDARVVLEDELKLSLFKDIANGIVGIQTADDPCYVLNFWELDVIEDDWEYMVGSPESRSGDFLGNSWTLRWEHGNGALSSQKNACIRGIDYIGSPGVMVHRMCELFGYRYSGGYFHQNPAAIFPKNETHLPAIWCFCSSPQYNKAIRQIDQSLKVTNATLVKVPFDLDHWTKIAEEQYPNGLPQPYSDDPTQWIFHGHPCGSVIWDEEKKWTAAGPLRSDETVLQIAVARLLGYRWPTELDPDMALATEQHAWVERCQELLPLADEDGIVCLDAVRREASGADRVRKLLATAYGNRWSNQLEQELIKAASTGPRPATDLAGWLRDHFFPQHCKIFQNRPFIWHIWDGLQDGFHCLVNAHKLTGPDGEGRRTLETVTYSYLGSWLDKQRAAQAEGNERAGTRLAHALDLEAQLEKILTGEPPYDIFVRWKPLHKQSTGWDPDINDGVRLNIRPFMKAELRQGGKKGAGLLRTKPNIKWGKDRGKEPQSLRPKNDFPWFWGCPGDGEIDFADGAQFDGNRWNDLHYAIATKQQEQGNR